MRHLRATVESWRIGLRSPCLVWLALALGTCLLMPRDAAAHVRLESSTPVSGTALSAMPAYITIAYSEAIDPAFSSANLLGLDGVAIAIGPLQTRDNDQLLVVPITDPASIAPGTYTLVWRVLSAADGHVTTGT